MEHAASLRQMTGTVDAKLGGIYMRIYAADVMTLREKHDQSNPAQ
jgi:hypothetical protein